MTASLTKRVEDLETAFWSKVEHIDIRMSDEASRFLRSIDPLVIPVVNAWLKEDIDARNVYTQMECIEKTLPPIHPAFLPAYEKIVRRHQWAIHHRADYRRMSEWFWARGSEYILKHFGSDKGNRLAVALKVYEKDIDQWTAQRQYLELPAPGREGFARDRIDFWQRMDREKSAHGMAEDQQSFDERLRKVAIEQERDLYGREMTEAELDLDIKQWSQLREDMESGKPASESEAARYLRDLIERYPRKG
jgi:hypothetical protein